MTPLLGGLAAALGWATATLLAAASSRRIGSTPTLVWVMLSGFLVTAPMAAATGWPEGLDGPAAGWLALAGVGNVAGLALIYAAMRRGQVGVVASIVSAEGAIAALIAIAAGERPAVVTSVGFLPLLVGIVLVSVGQSVPLKTALPGRRAGNQLAPGAAAAFGVSLFAAGQASDSVPLGWVALPARLIGVVILLGALIAGSHPIVSPRLGRLAIAAGVFEVVGLVAFAWGARGGIAVASVMASQFSALATLGAFFVFRERLVRRQLVGLAVLAVGVAMVALGSAG